jgi:Flp pilus assembly protein TadB
MNEGKRLKLLKRDSGIASDKAPKKRVVFKFKKDTTKGSYSQKLLRAGITLVLIFSFILAYPANFLGFPLFLFTYSASCFYLLRWHPEERAAKRQAKVIPHLAPFIDGLASALATGFNLEGAIAQASYGVPSGLLRSELDKVVGALNKGFTLSEATQVLRQGLSGKEVISLVIALNLFASLGGQILEPFRRLSSKIREQQTVLDRARRDLVMVKQAFYIIFGLAVLAPIFLIFVQPSYLKDAAQDATGRLLLQAGVMMIVVSLLIFKKITGLKV